MMPKGVERVTDLDDPRIAVYRSLKATNLTRGLGQFVVEGEKLVARLQASRFPVVSLLATDRYLPQIAGRVPAAVPVYVVGHDLIHSIVGFPFHRGVLACGQRMTWPSAEEILQSSSGRCTLVLCPRISNPENLGAIARIGDVFGIDAILTGPSCPDPFSRRVLRVSMGSALRVPVIPSDYPLDLARHLASAHGLVFWAAVADPRADPFEAVARPERLALVLGDEDHGVEPAWLEQCQRSITITMRPGAGSLNVAVAAGILLYQLTRQPPL